MINSFTLTGLPSYNKLAKTESRRQEVHHDHWITKAEKTGFNVLRVNTIDKDFEKNKKELNIIIQYIQDLENQAWLEGV